MGVGTPGRDRIGYVLLKRGFSGIADRLPNGEGGKVSITEAAVQPSVVRSRIRSASARRGGKTRRRP